MCDACKPPKKAVYQGKTLILEPQTCNCACVEGEFTGRGYRCPKCDHAVDISFTDDSAPWEPYPLYLVNGHPVRRDEVASA